MPAEIVKLLGGYCREWIFAGTFDWWDHVVWPRIKKHVLQTEGNKLHSNFVERGTLRAMALIGKDM